MYTLVRRFIKTGIGFLVAGLLLGAYMLVDREIGGRWPDPYGKVLMASSRTHSERTPGDRAPTSGDRPAAGAEDPTP